MDFKAEKAGNLYGCIAGILVPEASIEVLNGIVFERTFVHVFNHTMMAFKEPPKVGAHHPAPWAASPGGFGYDCHAQLKVGASAQSFGLSPGRLCSLVTSVLRVCVDAPVRLVMLSNLPFDEGLGNNWSKAGMEQMESSPKQFGLFKTSLASLGDEEISWVRHCLPTAAKLYHEDRFFRSFSIFEQAQWAISPEVAATLIWTSMEILFSISDQRDKTRRISRSLADYLESGQSGRVSAYQTIRDQYQKRSRSVHAGQRFNSEDLLQSIQLARVAFQRVLIDGRLPESHQ